MIFPGPPGPWSLTWARGHSFGEIEDRLAVPVFLLDDDGPQIIIVP